MRFDEEQVSEKPLGPVTVAMYEVAPREAFQEARREFVPHSVTAFKP